jgi:AAT family amino acid transporter
MIPMIWLINMMLINYWFMDGWPGWKLVPEAEAETISEPVINKEKEISWNPKFIGGLVAGAALAVILYFAFIKFLPWWCDIFTIIKSNV